MKIASDAAIEFGLSFGQVLDLASSIQSQIDTCLQRLPKYCEAIAIKDPTDRSVAHLSPSQKSDHVDIDNKSRYSSKGKKVKASKWRRNVIDFTDQMHLSESSLNTPRKQHAENIDTPGGNIPTDVCQRVVQNRAKAEKKLLHIEKYGNSSGLKIRHDFHCHICHVRRPKVCIFPCERLQHGYCDNHCKVRSCPSLIYLVSPLTRTALTYISFFFYC